MAHVHTIAFITLLLYCSASRTNQVHRSHHHMKQQHEKTHGTQYQGTQQLKEQASVTDTRGPLPNSNRKAAGPAFVTGGRLPQSHLAPPGVSHRHVAPHLNLAMQKEGPHQLTRRSLLAFLAGNALGLQAAHAAGLKDARALSDVEKERAQKYSNAMLIREWMQDRLFEDTDETWSDADMQSFEQSLDEDLRSRRILNLSDQQKELLLKFNNRMKEISNKKLVTDEMMNDHTSRIEKAMRADEMRTQGFNPHKEGIWTLYPGMGLSDKQKLRVMQYDMALSDFSYEERQEILDAMIEFAKKTAPELRDA